MHSKKFISLFKLTFFLFISVNLSSFAQGFEGYYRYPTAHNNTLIFSAEGDLWSVSMSGGLAQRLTTHAEEELFPKISPDGKAIAFTASYEGPSEVYVMPITGGLPTRWTYESDYSVTNGWTPNGNIVYDTRAYATQPERQLVTINTKTKQKERVPLNQASEASYDASGNTVYFVRPSYHGNVTKRYKGGTARQIWKYTKGSTEAVRLTNDYNGESHHPMWYNNRVYFLTARDGIMNIWSIDENGNDLQQHTKHVGFDARGSSVSNNGTIVYQLGADIWKYDINSGANSKINIRLASDLDHQREKWVENPSNYISNMHPDKDGKRIVITARGRVFVAPTESGRFVEFTDKKNVRLNDAVFSADGKDLFMLSDESGEFEFISLPANGIGSQKNITKNGKVLRYAGVPSPDGKWLAYDDLENNMFILNIASGVSKKISNNEEGIYSFSWSPDSKWLAFVQVANNTMAQILIHGIDNGDTFPITTDRANSLNPEWSPDGKFIYFLSDRSFTTLVGSPWGTRQPEPYFDASEKLYHIALQKGTRSPFREHDELYKAPENKDDDDEAISVKIDKNGITERIVEVPIKPGNYDGLAVTKNAIYFLNSTTGVNRKTDLSVVKITNDDPKVKTFAEGIRSFELTADGKKLLVRKGRNFYMTNASNGKADLGDAIDLSGWKFAISPQEDWHQLFTDAWRMERDYFYDKNMHGVNWKAMHDKYYPLVSRITTRIELSDLIGRFVGELAALHTSVRGGDTSSDNSNIPVANLGARLVRDNNNGGYKIDYIYKTDPDYPDEKSPLDDPYLNVNIGDIITSVNGKPALSALDIGELIRNQVGKQVRLSLKRGATTRDIIVKPIGNMYGLRYSDWEYSRRLKVEKQTKNKVGYLHLRAMGSNDLNDWYKEFYPVFDRPGLIIDVRNNRGGNIESLILEKLMRTAWMYWKSRSGKPYWNMPYAFRGHIVVLVNETTASDGEAFADGFKQLGLGTAIGTRTWGGEIWLHSGNRLTDGGLARAPMMGVYGEGKWRIEGHGFEPDIVVDNLPHATFNGSDAQLDAAIKFLENLIAKDPRSVPQPPAYPDKSFNNKN